jgi:hypothetical protein
VKGRSGGRGASKRHIIGWQTLFSLFVIFPFFWFSNFGHVTKFFLFSERIFFFFFPVPPSSVKFFFSFGNYFSFALFLLTGRGGREMKEKNK